MRAIIPASALFNCIAALCILFPFTPSYAGEAVNISADHLEYRPETASYIARGSVKLRLDNTSLQADEIRLNNETSDAVALGNVRYEDRETMIRTERMEINLKTDLGRLGKSYIFYKNKNYHINTEGIVKTGDTVFELDRSELTTCTADPPAWDLTSEHITIVQHERLVAEDASLRVKKVPVLYTPYLWAPLTGRRTSGLLLPSLGYSSRNGYYYKQGLFWALREDQDATFYLDYYDEKDIAKGIDYRYALTPEVNGEIWIYHVRDNDPARDLFEFKSYHNQKLPYNVSSFLKVHTVNKFDYYTEMDSTSSGRIGLKDWDRDWFGFSSDESLQKYLESNLHLSKNFKAGRTYFLGQYKRSLEGGSGAIPQNLPEIGLMHNTVSRGPASFNMSAKGINFWRKDGQKGQRVDIYPNVNLSFGRLVNLTQKIGMRETAYFLKDPSLTKYRTVFDLSTSLTTKVLKKYSSYVHIIEPSIEYAYIPPVDNDNLPVFDSVDSITHSSSINYSLTNRVSGLSTQNMETRFRLSQSYNLLDVEKEFSPLLAEANVSSELLEFKLNASYDVHDENVSEIIADVKLNGGKGYISVGKNFRRASSLSQMTLEAGANRPIAILPVDIRTKLWYDLHGNGVQQLTVETAYRKQCWGLIVNFDKRPNDYQISFAVEFSGLATFSL